MHKDIKEYDESQMILVGKFVDTYGLKGWLKLDPHLDKIHWRKVKRIFLKKRRGGFVPFEVEARRTHGDYILLKLVGYDSIDSVSSFSYAKVFLPKEELPKKNKDEYYYFELEGLDVYAEDGTFLGKITAVQDMRVYSLLEVDKGKLYIPFVEELVLRVEKDKVVVSNQLKSLRQ